MNPGKHMFSWIQMDVVVGCEDEAWNGLEHNLESVWVAALERAGSSLGTEPIASCSRCESRKVKIGSPPENGVLNSAQE